jgi:signal transduction histidine kinase
MDREKPELEEVRSAVTNIIRDGTRAGDVLRRIRQFVKGGRPSRVPLALGELLYDASSAVQAEARANHVTIRMRVADGLPLVLGDRVQLRQAVINLMMNAIEAMASLRRRPRILRIVADAPTAGEIRIAVTDSGEGFDPDKAEQIFSAFYTTKASGLGLGLAISRSVVEEHGGHLSASSRPDEGTTFEITLPSAGGNS